MTVSRCNLYWCLLSYFFTVPEDITDDCIWALSLFIRLLEECPEPVLRAVGIVKGDDYKYIKYATVCPHPRPLNLDLT
jgi:hypothetical protein